MEVYSSPSRRASSWAWSMTRFARGSSVERAARDPGAPREDRGDLAPERGEVHAEAPERLGGDPVVRADERGEQVLGVEHGALHPLGELLGGDDGLLGLLGESVELHGSGSRCGSSRSSWVSAGGPRVGLVDEVEERPRRVPRLVAEGAGQHDADLHVQVARAVVLDPRHALAGEAERPPALRPGRDR